MYPARLGYIATTGPPVCVVTNTVIKTHVVAAVYQHQQHIGCQSCPLALLDRVLNTAEQGLEATLDEVSEAH